MTNKTGWPWNDRQEQYPDKMPCGKPWPKISIVTPSFNQGRFLEATIRSILLQHYPNLEYIVIDGGSTDNSIDIIRKYEKDIAYWVSEPDNGHPHALNKGFSRATGEIMAWLNSDDMYAPSAFFVVAEIFDSFPEIQWITGKHSWWNEHDEQIGTQYTYKNVYDFLLGRYGWIQQESTFWCRSLWEAAGGKVNEEYEFMLDGELWCRFFLLTELWHCDRVLGGYRMHASNRAQIYPKEMCRVMEMAISELAKNCPARIKQRAGKLKNIRLLIELLRRIKMGQIGQKFARTYCKDIGYKRLINKNGKWLKTVSGFRL